MTRRVTLPNDILDWIREEGGRGTVGIARIKNRSSEGLVQVLGASAPRSSEDATDTKQTHGGIEPITSRLYRAVGPSPTDTLVYRVGAETAVPPELRTDGALADSTLTIPVDGQQPVFETTDEQVNVNVLRTDDSVFERVADIIDTDYLADKTVAVIGLGTGGSTVALELAKSGVGNFYLYDPDELEVHNVSRHVCDLSDVGREKVYAVGDALRRRNPGVNVTTHAIDILDDRSTLRQGIQAADCVLACTDTQLSRGVINEEAVAARTPVIYAGAYERAYGGDVVRYEPTRGTPCYACIHGTPDPMEGTPRNEDGTFDYSAASDIDSADFAAEPGLSVDVGFIALMQTRYAIATLARATDADVVDLPHDISMWGNRERDEFEKPFQHLWIGYDKEPDCPVCGPDGTAAQLRASISNTDGDTSDGLLEDIPEATDLDVDLGGNDGA